MVKPTMNQFGSTLGQVQPGDFHAHHFENDDDSDGTAKSPRADDLFLDDAAEDDKPAVAVPNVPILLMDE